MPDIKTTLLQLAGTVQKIVADAREEKAIEPEESAFFQWKVRDFQYTDDGIKSAGADGSYITRRTWFRAYGFLERQISGHDDFKSALANLDEEYPTMSDTEAYLDRFVHLIIAAALEREDDATIRHQTASIIDRFVAQLSGALITNKAKVEVVGVTLQPKAISLEPGVTIRQPIKEDLEVISGPIGFGHHELRHPSVIIDIELRSARPENVALQAKVEQCIAVLRLFGVGSVRWMTYEMSSDSLLDLGATGTLGGGERFGALETYLVRGDDESRVQRFWKALVLRLPKDIYYFPKQISYLTLAYDRYSDALLHNGVIERRIANAVMGFEALFLEESLELSYRLGLRISKTLAALGRNPLEVREHIKDAYAIRSTYAHGGHLAYKAKKKLDGKYGDIKKLLRLLLDYLRVSILVSVFARLSKEELVDLVDDALVDSVKNEELRNQVSETKALLGT